MNIIPILKEIIKGDIITFTKENFTVSLFAAEKKISMSPIDETKDVDRVRSLINDLRNDFQIDKVTQLGMNTFEVIFDPTEDFTAIRSFIKEHGSE